MIHQSDPRSHRPVSSGSAGRFRARSAALVAGLASVLALGACAPTIGVPVAPGATEPVCASAVLAAPPVLAQQPQARTTSQATAAWGAAGSAITLRCGVAPLEGPLADCLALTDAAGDEYDWIAQRTTTGWRFTTYGRAPALEVQLPDTLGLDQPTAPLLDLGTTLRTLEVTDRCE